MQVFRRRLVLLASVLALLTLTTGIALAWRGSVSAAFVNVSQVSHAPHVVIKANDPGCNDHFAVYQLNYLPGKAGSANVANQAHMNNNGGLHGFWNTAPYGAYYKYDVYMCVKHWWPNDGFKYLVAP